LMMTRWSTDACRRDPSIVSSNLTNPTFSLQYDPGPGLFFRIYFIAGLFYAAIFLG
jgi:hypothetical protein